MEADTALVRANGHAVLDAVATVDLHLALVVGPADAELDDALSFHQTLQQGMVSVLGVLLDEGPQRLHYFGDGLQEFRLTGVAISNVLQKLVEVGVLHGEQVFQGTKIKAPQRTPKIMPKMYAFMHQKRHDMYKFGA